MTQLRKHHVLLILTAGLILALALPASAVFAQGVPGCHALGFPSITFPGGSEVFPIYFESPVTWFGFEGTIGPWSCGYFEGDADFDGVKDNVDNCPTVANADQKNTYGGPAGDACEEESATRIYQGEVVVYKAGNGNVQVYSATGTKLAEVWSANLTNTAVGGNVPTDNSAVSITKTGSTQFSGAWQKPGGGTTTFSFSYP